jgi:lysophospholipase L1-like esterase
VSNIRRVTTAGKTPLSGTDISRTGAVGQALVATAVDSTGAVTSGGYQWPDLPEFATTAQTAVVGTPANMVGKLTRYDTTAGVISQTLPAATPGRVFAVGWDAGANALTLIAAGSDVIGSGSATTASLPFAGAIRTYHCTTAGRWRLVGGNDSTTALDARYAAAGMTSMGPEAHTAILFGDSVVAQCEDETVSQTQGFYSAYSWTNWANMFLGNRLQVVRNAGVGGNTTAQMLARFDTDVAPYLSQCEMVIMDGGVNDLFDGGGTTLATMQANLTAIFTKILAAGKRAVMMIPTGSGYGTATTLTNLYTLHRWLKKYAREHRGITLFDGNGWFCDPADGWPVAGYVRPGDAVVGNNNRGVHPGFIGAARIGRALADALELQLDRAGGSTVSTNVDALNLIANGRMVGDQGGGLATSWSLLDNSGSAATGVTTTKSTSAVGRPGAAQQITWTGSGSACRLFQQNTDTSKWATGDLLFGEVEFESDPDTAGNYGLKLAINSWNSGSTASTGSLGIGSNDTAMPVAAGVDVLPRRGVLRTPPFAVPLGTLRIQSALYCPVGTIRVLSFAVRKVDY